MTKITFIGPWVWVFAIAAAALIVILVAVRRVGLAKRTSLPSLDFPVWDPAKSRESLQALFDITLKQGEAAIEWYQDNIRPNRAASRILRSLAIILASLGALLPLVIAAISRFRGSEVRLVDAQWGYIAFAAAAACVAADKFYGFSTGWIRFMKTQLALERALSDLRYDWIVLVATLPGHEPTADQIQVMVHRLKDFVTFVRAQIEQETDAWVLEFQSNLADLASAVKSKAEVSKPGSLQVTVSNANDFDPGIKAYLDQATEKVIQGTQCLFSVIPPGTHEVLVRGKRADRTYETASVVKIASDSLASVSLTLPLP